MKKTFSTLLALSSISMAATEIDLTEETNFYDISGITFGDTYLISGKTPTKNNISVALTLDISGISKLSNESHTALLTVQGKNYRNADATQCIGLGIDYDDISAWSGKVTNENLVGGGNQTGISISLDNSAAKNITLVFSSYAQASNNKETWTVSVMFWGADGNLLGDPLTGKKTQTQGIDTLMTLYLNKDVISSAVIYDTVLNDEEAVAVAKKLITISPAAPEPTTATLSLLALAGLAARRRRA